MMTYAVESWGRTVALLYSRHPLLPSWKASPGIAVRKPACWPVALLMYFPWLVEKRCQTLRLLAMQDVTLSLRGDLDMRHPKFNAFRARQACESLHTVPLKITEDHWYSSPLKSSHILKSHQLRQLEAAFYLHVADTSNPPCHFLWLLDEGTKLRENMERSWEE